jgi:hypothetical protein
VVVALAVTGALMALALVVFPSGWGIPALAVVVPAAAVLWVWGYLGRGQAGPAVGEVSADPGDARGWREW